MIPKARSSYPTPKLCSGGAGEGQTQMHDWFDHVDRTPLLVLTARAFQDCPAHDGLPNAMSMEHLAAQHYSGLSNPSGYERRNH